MEHVAAADGVARDHGDDGLGQRADLALEVEHVEARDAVVADVAALAADALIAARAEGVRALAAEDDDADLAGCGSAIDRSWGAGTRTPNDSTRNCCVTNYTTPHGVTADDESTTCAGRDCIGLSR